MDITIIKTVAEAGGIGVAFISMYFLYKIVSNHEVHFTDAIIKNTEALTKLCDCIENLKDKIK